MLMFDTGQTVILIAWLLLFPYPIIFILYYNNRGLYPIKGRFPHVAMLQAVGMFFFATIQVMRYTFGVSCGLSQWLMYWTGLEVQYCFNYRLVKLLFHYGITQNITEMKDNRNLPEWNTNFYVKNRFLAQDYFFFKAIVIASTFDMINCILWEIFDSNTCSYVWALMWIGRGMLSLIPSAIAGIKMWKFPPDAFGIKSEFKMLIGGAFSLCVIFLFISIAFPENSWLVWTGLIFAVHPMLFFTLAIPCYQSLTYKQQMEEDEEADKPQTLTLEMFLMEAEGIKLFLAYLETEFSTENLLFYIDVIGFKSLPVNDLGRIQNEVQHIYDKFFKMESPCALNLPSEIQEETANQVQQLVSISPKELPQMASELLSVFDRAQSDIYRLMASDSWYRFQRTPVFQKIKESRSSSMGQYTNSTPQRKGKNGKENKNETDKLLESTDGALEMGAFPREEAISTPSPTALDSPSKFSLLPHSTIVNEMEASNAHISTIFSDHTEPATPSQSYGKVNQETSSSPSPPPDA